MPETPDVLDLDAATTDSRRHQLYRVINYARWGRHIPREVLRHLFGVDADTFESMLFEGALAHGFVFDLPVINPWQPGFQAFLASYVPGALEQQDDAWIQTDAFIAAMHEYVHQLHEASTTGRTCALCGGTISEAALFCTCPACGAKLHDYPCVEAIPAVGRCPICQQRFVKGSRGLIPAATQFSRLSGFRCAVCGRPLEATDPVSQCPHCEAMAHQDHLLDWIRLKGNCPACRKPVLGDFCDASGWNYAFTDFHGESVLTSDVVALREIEDVLGKAISRAPRREDLGPSSLGYAVTHARVTALALPLKKFPEVPPALGDLTGLRALWISGKRLRTLPASLANLHSLDHLEIDAKKLDPLPPALAEWRAGISS